MLGSLSIALRDTLARCRARNFISEQDATDLKRLMNLRNPLSHHRLTDGSTNLS